MDQHLIGDETVPGFLCSRMDEIANGMVDGFISRYPNSKSSALSRQTLVEWTRDELAELCAALRGEPVEPYDMLRYSGDLAKGKSDLFLPFANYIETKMFVGEWITIYLWSRSSGSPRQIQSACEEVEAAMLRTIKASLDRYTQTTLVPGSLLRRWTPNPLGSEESGATLTLSRHNAGLNSLTRQERRVLELAVQGKTNGEIASKLGIAPNTVRNHLAHVYDKTGVSNRTELTNRYFSQE